MFFVYFVRENMKKYVSTYVLIKYVGPKYCKYVLHSNSDNDGREVHFKVITTRYFAAQLTSIIITGRPITL